MPPDFDIADQPALPIDDVTVVDFTSNGAGPACTMLLGDFGANVIKIESRTGDNTRHWGSSRLGERGDLTPSFVSLNRNKSSVVLDLKSAEGKREVLRLIGGADVVIESFTPGVMARLGLHYDDLDRPDLVYCSLSGFGQTGPLANRPGFDMLMQAFAGHMSITGEEGRPSIRNGPSSIDLLTAAHAALGIVLALMHRKKTGFGQYIDISLFDTSLYLSAPYVTEFNANGAIAGKFGSHLPLMTPYGIFKARDREFFIGVSDDAMFAKFAAALGRAELMDARFSRNASRTKLSRELNDLLGSIFATADADIWVDVCVNLGVPTSLVRNMGEVARDTHAEARGLLIDSGLNGLRTVGTPFKMSRTPGRLRKPPPGLDQDRASIVRDPSNP